LSFQSGSFTHNTEQRKEQCSF